MKYKDFVLDQFQEDAIHAIEHNHSVVVSAATGTGKTLTADYIIDKSIKDQKRVIYTAPIKALSNQKYRDFIHTYGEDKIGILTGDVVINENAPILIMTTEIYRNMLLEGSMIEHLSYVIFDEIHYMNDPERGTVWEESIIFSPPSVRFLCLSATIPNAHTFASWIKEIKGHEVEVVTNPKRAVPLKHLFFTNEDGICEPKKLRQIIEMELSAERMEFGRKKKGKFSFKDHKGPNQILLVRNLIEKDHLPCIFFSFSRSLCRSYAIHSENKFDFTSPKEKGEIGSIFRSIIPNEIRHMKSMQEIRRLVNKGIGIHHAGLLPKAKELVEVLFGKGLIKVLYATETFAVGINMPARSVVFNSLRKFDGRTFRNLYTKEYFQIAGRAGRRGIDHEGFVYAMIDKKLDDIYKIIRITEGDSEPILSQFSISVNMVLNMMDLYSDDKIEEILRQNFGYFVKKREDSRQIRINRSFNNVVRKLEKLNYIQNRTLTAKGKIAARIYSNELLITELIFTGAFNNLNEIEINVLIGSIVYEGRRQDRFKARNNFKPVDVDMNNPVIQKELNISSMKKIDWVVRLWCHGETLDKTLEKSNWQEGDIIRFFRQIIDRLQQIKNADPQFKEKMNQCIDLIDKDVVKVDFS